MFMVFFYRSDFKSFSTVGIEKSGNKNTKRNSGNRKKKKKTTKRGMSRKNTPAVRFELRLIQSSVFVHRVTGQPQLHTSSQAPFRATKW